MKWIVGLGNPGKKYEDTRHNAGFMVVDRLAERWAIPVNQDKFRAHIGEGRVHGQKVYLLKPQTFMNLSGESMRAFADFYKANLEDMILIYDDLDTALGSIRLRYQGSAGGHNGLKSIIAHMGTQQFNRIRVGIDRPQPGIDIADYVLSPFPKSSREALDQALDRACEATERALSKPFEKVMGLYNS
jgi:PTH1 family peptidyl-tRNA hydrolase